MINRKQVHFFIFFGIFAAAAPIWGSDGGFGQALAAGGPGAYVKAVGLGFLASLTPCILPMIPIVLAIFGANPDASLGRRFLLSFTYVQGMATLYTVLGIIAALTGSAFGSHNSSIYVQLFMVAVFFYLGLVFAGYAVIPIPRFIQKFQTENSKIGYLPAYSLGLVSGFIAASCSAPAYFLILDEIRNLAQGGSVASSVLVGFTLSYAFAFGIGLLFILVAVFGLKVPKSGKWQNVIKYGGAMVLFTVALVYLARIVTPLQIEWMIKTLGVTGDSFDLGIGFALPPGLFFMAVAGLVILSVVYVLAPPSSGEPVKSRLRIAAFYVLGSFAFYYIGSAVLGLEPVRRGKIVWTNHCTFLQNKSFTDEHALNLVKRLNQDTHSLNGAAVAVQAKKTAAGFLKQSGLKDSDMPACMDELVAGYQAKPVLIDFWAEWCVQCKVLENTVLKEEHVAEKLKQFHLLKIDVTEGNPAQEKLQKSYGVLGLPTLKFLAKDGSLSPKDFRGANLSEYKMLKLLDSLLQDAGGQAAQGKPAEKLKAKAEI